MERGRENDSVGRCERTWREWLDTVYCFYIFAEVIKKECYILLKKGNTNLYFPVLKQKEYDMSETESFLSKIYKGSVKNLVAALYENKKLSKEDMSELKSMFDLEWSICMIFLKPCLY